MKLILKDNGIRATGTVRAVVVYWYRGLVVISTAQLNLTKPELMFYSGTNTALGVLEICDGEGDGSC